MEESRGDVFRSKCLQNEAESSVEARDLHKIKVCRRDFRSAEGLWICGTSDSFESENLVEGFGQFDRLILQIRRDLDKIQNLVNFLPIRVEVMFSDQNVCKTGRRVVWKQETYIK